MLRELAAVGDPTHGLTQGLAQIRTAAGAEQKRRTAQLLRLYAVRVEKKDMAGVPVAFITPVKPAAHSKDRLLINVHGGAFFLGQGSIEEAIPIAALTGIAVLAIDYRLAPEHPFPAAVDDKRVYVNTFGVEMAFDIDSGKLVWRSGKLHLLQLQQQRQGIAPERYGILVSGDRTWSVLRDPQQANQGVGFAMVVREAATGKEVFTTRRSLSARRAVITIKTPRNSHSG